LKKEDVRSRLSSMDFLKERRGSGAFTRTSHRLPEKKKRKTKRGSPAQDVYKRSSRLHLVAVEGRKRDIGDTSSKKKKGEILVVKTRLPGCAQRRGTRAQGPHNGEENV